MEGDHPLRISNHWDVLAGPWERVAVLGVGNELNGDDAAGLLVARMLKALVAGRGQCGDTPVVGADVPVSAVLILEAGPAPENFTGALRRFGPDLVIFVDAADFNQPPGSVAWLDWADSDGLSASTHTLPPSVLAQYLAGELGCRLVLVGIQPLHLDFDRPLSEPVMQAVQRISRELAAWLRA